MNDNPLRKLPPVNEVLGTPALMALAGQHPRELIVRSIRSELAALRAQLKNGAAVDGVPDADWLAARVAQRLHQTLQPKLRRVINATGIVLHTNLGRAPMAEEAARAAYEAARGYLNLELDLHTGKRSSRQNAVRDWLCQITGAESATAVNNNAAATVICLRALAQGKEVVISRGQLIEIGGSFRIPDIMGVSGAMLREVGTTNITRLSDYERAIGPATGALMQIHTSNYRVRGFTKSVPLKDLVELGRKHKLPVIDDVGSGALLDFARFGFEDEPAVQHSVRAGADLVLFSGDKLLGGPQAGLIVGRKQWVQKIEKDPLMRAFRLDKMTLAALEATLRIYLDQDKALHQVPTLHLLHTPVAELRRRAEHLAGHLEQLNGVAFVQVCDDRAYVGGGSLPDQSLPTVVVEVQAHSVPDTDLAQRLRTGTPAVLGRLRDSKLVLDLRTIFPEQESLLVEAIRTALATEQD
jgi:L-seryl-tRNA(Ser) seleniumtransferase